MKFHAPPRKKDKVWESIIVEALRNANTGFVLGRPIRQTPALINYPLQKQIDVLGT
jgi:hypothetical protein